MAKSIRIVGLFLFAFSTAVPSDGAAATFEKWFGTPQNDYLREVVQARDGSFAVAGYMRQNPSIPEMYGFLAKLDANGDTIWTRNFNASTYQYFSSLAEMDDSSLVAAGYYYGGGIGSGYVVRTDSQGDTIWTRRVGNTSTTAITQARIASDGSILLAGIKYNAISESSKYDVFLLRLDENGDTLSADLYGGLGDDRCSDLIQLSTGEYVIVGATTPSSTTLLQANGWEPDLLQPSLPKSRLLYDGTDPYGHIYFLDSGRSVVWEDTIPNSGYAKWSVEEIGDHEVILSGVVNTAALNSDIFLAHIDASPGGGVDWLRTFDWPGDDDSRAIAKFSSDLILIVGNTKSLGPVGDYDAQVALVDIHGDTLYTKLYGYENWEELSSICMTDDGDFIAVGGTNSRGEGEIDAYAIKGSIPSLAAFKASATSGGAPLTVQFEDISTFTATSWEWDFDNDGTVDSYSQNPSYEYTEPGIYSVELVAGDGVTNYTRVKNEFIVVGNTAFFAASPTEGCNPLTVYFHDQSGGVPTAWEWDFENDGTVDSYEENPIHTYDSIGVYSVKLTVRYGGESQVLVKNDYIAVNPRVLVVKPDGTGDVPTIRDAVNSSQKGWIIELTDGVFTGVGNRGVEIRGDMILMIRSQSDDPEACIIDCEDLSMAFNIGEYEGLRPDVTIRGITIRNAYGSDVGGGMRYWTAKGSVINCRFEDCYAVYSGGGIYCNESAPLIQNCVFVGNETGGGGGAVYMLRANLIGSSVDIEGCEFTGNVADLGGGLLIDESSGHITGSSFVGNSARYGAGIWSEVGGDIVFTNCRITGNSSSVSGGGLCYSGGTLQMEDCLVAENSAVYTGGGCKIGCDSLLISGCTVVADSTESGRAGGLELSGTGYAVLDNTLIAFNEALGIAGFSAISISCSDIYGNEDGDWTGAIASQLGVNGNISEDPLFCDRTADMYTLQEESPCLPAANPSCGLIGADSIGCAGAQFAANPTAGLAPLTIQFTDLTPGSPDAWAWDFQNDGVVDATSQNPSFEYQTGGKYSVRLKAYRAGHLIANAVKHNLIDILDGNNVLIRPLDIFTEGTSPLPIVYCGSESLGAISLYFEYDDTKLEYAGIETYVPGEYFSGGLVGGKISVQWFDETGGSDPIVPGLDPDTLFAIKFTNLALNDTSHVSFDTTQCALGDAIGDPIPDVHWLDESPYGVVNIDIGAYVSGNVEYYWMAAPVPGARLSMGPPNPDVSTDAAGYYLFDRYPYGSYVLNISKTDDLAGINSLDAIKVIRHSTGVEPLGNSHKLLAANVNGDGNINALDAMKIVRAAVQLEPLASGNWRFDPDSVQIDNLNGDRSEDFIAVRMGDVNGDWAPDLGAAPPPLALQGSSAGRGEVSLAGRAGNVSAPLQTISVAMPDDTVGTDIESVAVPILVTEFNDIGAISFRIAFEDTILAYDRLESNCGRSFTSNLVGNEVRIEWYDGTGGSNPLNLGSDTLLTLHFEIVGEENETSLLDFTGQSTIADASGDPIVDVTFIDGSITMVHQTATDEGAGMPRAFMLHGCWPNPFNPSTHIQFDIPFCDESRVWVSLKIYNVLGQLVKKLLDDRVGPGRYEAVWDGRNESGAEAASGVYFYRLEAGRYTDARKMLLIR